MLPGQWGVQGSFRAVIIGTPLVLPTGCPGSNDDNSIGRHTAPFSFNSKSFPAGPMLIFVNIPAWTVKGRNDHPPIRFVRREAF